MKFGLLLTSIIFLGCSTPEATTPKESVKTTASMEVLPPNPDSKIYDVEFFRLKPKFTPAAPSYPEQAKIERVQGVVVVEVIIDRDGVPTSARALEGPILLRSAAENYAMQWRYLPVLINNSPQITRCKYTMPYRLRSN